MEVHTKNQMATTYNAFGVLKGKEEPGNLSHIIQRFIIYL